MQGPLPRLPRQRALATLLGLAGGMHDRSTSAARGAGLKGKTALRAISSHVAPAFMCGSPAGGGSSDSVVKGVIPNGHGVSGDILGAGKISQLNEVEAACARGVGPWSSLFAYGADYGYTRSDYDGSAYGSRGVQTMPEPSEYTTFVSHHYRILTGDIVEYLRRKRMEYVESPIKLTLKFCPFCPPHKYKSDNLYKHEIFKNSGNSYCHRCGYKGSLYDFKAAMGDLPGGMIEEAMNPSFSGNPFSLPMVSEPAVTLTNIAQYEHNLFHGERYKPVLDYLTETRGISIETLKRYRVGAGEFSFSLGVGKGESELCVVFPWLMGKASSGNSELVVNRIKVRSIQDKSRMKLVPRGGGWGMFGEHLLASELAKSGEGPSSVVLTEGEFDAMVVNQTTGRVAVSLPNGSNSLPVALLPRLEKVDQIYLWMDFDAAGQGSVDHFASKLGIQRTRVIRDVFELPRDSNASRPPKDANEIFLRGLSVQSYVDAAAPMSHSQILNFNDIRQNVFEELSNPCATSGITSITLPGLSQLLKGHRRGELTVWTGATGSGKTTILSQLSLDYCMQGVSTLWGSFEINNVRLAKTMLRQFSGRNLETSLEDFNYYADKFSELPLRFMKFHGSTSIDQVIDAMDYAVYVHDVRHIIIDNLQFMLSGQNSRVGEIWEIQNKAIEKFRRFATNKNVHVSLVVHPRKEADGTALGMSSVFGSVKSTQEADNVLILQNVVGENRCIDVKKNRFAGNLGRVTFRFDPLSLTAEELKVTEFVLEASKNTQTEVKPSAKAFDKLRPPEPKRSAAKVAVTIDRSTHPLAYASTSPAFTGSQLVAGNVGHSTARPMSTYRLNSVMHDERNQTGFVHDSDLEENQNPGCFALGDLFVSPSDSPTSDESSSSSVVAQGSAASTAASAASSADNPAANGGTAAAPKRGRKPKVTEATAEVDEETITMRGKSVTRSSSIKEYREFIKANGLGELIKTAGKGIVKADIYDKIKQHVPPSSISSGAQHAAAPSPAASTTSSLDFGVSTVEPLLTRKEVDVDIFDDIDDFRARMLRRTGPGALLSKAGVKPVGTVKLPVHTLVEGHDELLPKGIIYVRDVELLERLAPLFENTKLCALDIETTGLDHRNDHIRLLQISTPDQPAVIIDVFKVSLEAMRECRWLRSLLSSSAVKVLHNGKFDINFLSFNGLPVKGAVFDTMIAAKLLSATRFNWSCKLGHVAERYLNIALDKSQQFSDWTLEPLFEEQLIYASRDAAVLLPLYFVLQEKLKSERLDSIASIENKCVLAVCQMEQNGIRVDRARLESLQRELNSENEVAMKRLGEALGVSGNANFNYNSQRQILQALQNLNVMDKSRRMLIQDTSERTLARNTYHPAIEALREYRKANKAVTAFTEKIPNHIDATTGRIYPNINQIGAESGRFSCDNPNLQQIPRDHRFRECFVADPGHKFVIADFSQIELRIAADIAEDRKMIEAYNSGQDLHALTASLVKGKPIAEVTKDERQLAKAVNFGLIFGMSLAGFRNYAEVGYGVRLGMNEAREIYDSFFRNYSGIANWHERMKNSKPMSVRTLSNRLSIFDQFSFTRSLNYPVQGTSADITKEAMALLVDRVEAFGGRMVLCVHDEIILEVPDEHTEEALRVLVGTMEAAGNKFLRYVPCEAVGSVGGSWAEK
ncbi:DNA polymerase I, putative [Babesia bigemina]|uniref:DNA polymerase I, putative n=1 Tax=Babesia bigemina TaxID=5866 RepID=A0A061D4X6_BABBI|nr:DNA polymerase I, putative [Babesia bigemina]CDR95746.1 DNA polymerase I, putative [Babesia bigemina]|eukprot:XP_012767932.1 DNA polymerase I, putative [Babesia bigemina]